jgi:hypothetical protein
VAFTQSAGAPTQNQNSCVRAGGGGGGQGGFSPALGQASGGSTGEAADAFGF